MANNQVLPHQNHSNSHPLTATSESSRIEMLPPLRASPSDLTQSSLADVSDTNSTASTSSSIHLSNHSDVAAHPVARSSMSAPKVEGPGFHIGASRPHHQFEATRFDDLAFSRTSPLSPPKCLPAVELTPGLKRTVNGDVKCSISPERRTPAAIVNDGRLRSLSTDSNSSRIAEISAQLRARLSYAAAKVEKDWQSNSNRDNVTSPRQNRPPTQNGSSFAKPIWPPQIQSVNGETHAPSHRDPYPPTSTNSAGFSHPPPPQRGLHFRNNSISIHGNNRSAIGNGHSRNTHSLSNVPRLAPPADIVPGNTTSSRRRPNPNDCIPKKTSNPNYNYNSNPLPRRSLNGNALNPQLIPETPPPQFPFQRPGSLNGAVKRTPSQNALMEQDAIETLLFMSSPENSGYHPSSRQQEHLQQSTSKFPNIAHFTAASSLSEPEPGSTNSTSIVEQNSNLNHRDGASEQQPPKKVSFADSSKHPSSHYPIHSRPNLELEAGDEIDRMLDEMEDSDSEQDYNWLANYGSRQ